MSGKDPAAGGAMPVELREDAPLQAGAGDARCAGGPRLIIACFAALSAAISLALFAQIHSGDYEVVPHGGVAADAAACSGAGTDALKAGGRALDAAAAAALCLAVAAPHLTSLDASGSLLYWEYRRMRGAAPTLAEWGGARRALSEPRAPRLLVALAALHAAHGALPWPRLLQPAIDLAREGFPVSRGLAAALAVAAAPGDAPAPAVGSLRTAPLLAAYLRSLQANTSAELSAAWRGAGGLRVAPAEAGAAGAWRVYAGGAGAAAVRGALAHALAPRPAGPDDAAERAVAALRAQALQPGAWPPAPGGVSTGLAVIDSFDTYVALVTGLSAPFGAGAAGAPDEAWPPDEPAAPLDLAPAILLDDRVCGTRYVVGAGSGAALAQTAAALAAGGDAGAAERARVLVRPGGGLAPDVSTAVNVVRQRADALLSHADSRGGGLASRF